MSLYTFYPSSVSITSHKLSSDYRNSGLTSKNNSHLLGLSLSGLCPGASEGVQVGAGEPQNFHTAQNSQMFRESSETVK
jgi:hypothetical protein